MKALGVGSQVIATSVEFTFRRDFAKQPPKDVGRWLSDRLPKVGPTFTKLGQFLASRPDIFGEDISNELSRLRSDVSPLPFSTIESALYKDQSLVEVLDYVDDTPLASASIAQVHRARLVDGTDVVLKVRRPNVKEQLTDDLQLLRAIFELLQRSKVPGFDDALSVLSQFHDQLILETNFDREMRAMKRFRKAYSHNMYVKVPEVYDALCTEGVLVMEYVPSKKLDDTIARMSKQQKRITAIMLMTTFMSQMLHGGLLHADPHAGNLGFDPRTQQLVLYDFGNVILLSKDMRDAMNNILTLVPSRDVEGIIGELPKLGIKINQRDALEEYINSYITYLENLDIQKLVEATTAIASGTSTDSSITSAGSHRVPMVISNEIAGVMRVFSMLEGACKQLDPDFKYDDVMIGPNKTIPGNITNMPDRMSTDVRKVGSIILGRSSLDSLWSS
jgi:predicted unusual protein kinase regulating ubiquinone biosynthesis (AarF/ABC1/UbiB family)